MQHAASAPAATTMQSLVHPAPFTGCHQVSLLRRQRLDTLRTAAAQRLHLVPQCSSQGQRQQQQQLPSDTEKAGTTLAALQSLRQRAVAALAAAALALAPLAGPILHPLPAAAVLNSPNAQIARSADVALRRAIPGNNGYMRSVQSKLESIQFKLRIPQRKPWGAISEDATNAAITMAQLDKVLEGTPSGKEAVARRMAGDIQEGLRRLKGVIDQQDPGKVSFRVADVLKDVGELEILQAPGLPYIFPREYADLTHLTGRAVVELTVEKQDGSLAYVTNEGGGPQKEAHLTLVLDGYSAPLTAGNFVRNVLEGVYSNVELKVDQGAILAGGGSLGRTLPLEILPIGQFDIVYRSPLDVRGGELPVLPLSIYGALAMSHAPNGEEGGSTADEFFIYKFDRQSSGLAGLSFDEGEFATFGYVTKGSELIPQLGSGDVVTGARLVSGGERLVNAPSTIAERAMKASVMYGMP